MKDTQSKEDIKEVEDLTFNQLKNMNGGEYEYDLIRTLKLINKRK